MNASSNKGAPPEGNSWAHANKQFANSDIYEAKSGGFRLEQRRWSRAHGGSADCKTKTTI